MPRRPMEEALYAVLISKQFRFMHRHGEVPLDDIYQAVVDRYPMLCDNDKQCIHNNNYYGPHEWEHVVRDVLDSLQKKGKKKKFRSAEQQGVWIFP